MNINWIKKYCINNLLNKNDYISLHPLLSIKLIEGLEEIVFRLGRSGRKEVEEAGKIISFFLAGKFKSITLDAPKVK